FELGPGDPLESVALIVVSVGGVWFVVAATRQTAPVFAAATTLLPGETVESADLRVVDVALGPMHDSYASPTTLRPGAVATRVVRAGELVPNDALGEAGGVRSTTVVITSASDVPSTVETGSSVDVWAAAPRERGAYDTPRILVGSATVASVDRDRSMMGAAAVSVEIVIDRADVAATLAAIADGSSLSIVPSGGAGS
ncbi:hypothetical protein, partial [Microbacterium sp. B24]|uniref:hypothetical protein n=1 Tax=Microbacterium sp. B24 TaxID=95616 RepID=UPI0006890E83